MCGRPAIRLRTGAVFAAVVAITAVGCRAPDLRLQHPNAGVVWLFPGVEGGARLLYRACNAYRDHGVDAELRIFDWQRVGGTLANLTDYDGNRARAVKTAREIAEYQRLHPERTIDLVGYSGGGGMAIFVAEELPTDVRVRNIVLAHPALSPDYNLTRALRHVDGTLVNFHSPADWLILGAGTTVWGTMDRKHVASAGKVGFDTKLAVPDRTLRERLCQRRWNKAMLEAAHLGNHISIMNYEWNKRFVAPYLDR